MKIISALTTLALGLALVSVLPAPQAQAQTQCPAGATPGSIVCGPDAAPGGGSYAPPPPRRTRLRYQGLAAFSYNLDTGQVYSFTMHGSGYTSPKWRALEICQRPNYDRDWSISPPSEPDANCESLTEWENACAAVAVSEVQGVRRYFSQPARNARAARTAAMSQCEANGGNCAMAHDAVCVSPATRYRED